jgi:hypothetical protein
MTTDTKLQLHNITCKAGLCYSSENWILNNRGIHTGSCTYESLETLLGLTRLDRQRKPDIRNRLKVDNLVEDIKLSTKTGKIT